MELLVQVSCHTCTFGVEVSNTIDGISCQIRKKITDIVM